MNQELNVTGTFFESCNCFAACPCICLSPPSEGECKVLLAWHIDKGMLGGVTLDGLNAALFAHAPGHMMQTKWKVALYVDQRADAAQQEALGKVFSGAAGGPLAALAPLIGEVMGVRPAAIEYRADGKRRSVRIDGVAEADVEALAGQDGGEVTVSNHPFTPVPGQTAVVAKSSRMRYADHGYQCELSGRSALYSPFEYRG
jgi:hypothetical protein